MCEGFVFLLKYVVSRELQYNIKQHVRRPTGIPAVSFL